MYGARCIELTSFLSFFLRYGTEVDSMGSFHNVGYPPYRMHDDFKVKQFMELDGQVLRFEARIVTERPEDLDRNLVIAYYLADDTQAIYEPVQRNSGVVGGKFLERGSYGKGGNHKYEIKDFQMGAEMVWNGGYKLRIVKQDTFTVKYFAEHNLNVA